MSLILGGLLLSTDYVLVQIMPGSWASPRRTGPRRAPRGGRLRPDARAAHRGDLEAIDGQDGAVAVSHRGRGRGRRGELKGRRPKRRKRPEKTRKKREPRRSNGRPAAPLASMLRIRNRGNQPPLEPPPPTEVEELNE